MKNISLKKSIALCVVLACGVVSGVSWAHEHEATEEVAASKPHEHEEAAVMAMPSHEEHGEVKGKIYLVRSGDTLDRVIQKNMPNSPLKIELLREAIAHANPQVFTHPGSYHIRAGQVLQIPEMAQVVRSAVGPYLQNSENLAQNDEQARRRWVRYP